MCEAMPPEIPDPVDDRTLDAQSETRRRFLHELLALAGGAVLLNVPGCAAGGRTTARAMPGPAWRPLPPGAFDPPPSASPPPHVANAPAATPFPGILPRSRWTAAPPHLPTINPMGPIHAITVHHDGMRPFYEATESASATRLELIRRSHRDRRNWSDIGYHFAIDRNGRIFECRSLAYQGAHVQGHNEGNIGVLLIGNFDEQSPSDSQIGAMRDHVSRLMRHYNVHASRLFTHREWPGAATACPGRALQHHMAQMRSRRMFG